MATEIGTEANARTRTHHPGYGIWIVCQGRAHRHTLMEGSWSVGSKATADIQIPSSQIAPHHLTLHLLGDNIRVQTEHNSKTTEHSVTRVRSVALNPGAIAHLHAGESIELGGEVLLVVHKRQVPRRMRRFWNAGHFSALLDEECQRAQKQPTPGLAVWRFRLFQKSSALKGDDNLTVKNPQETLDTIVSAGFRASDIIARHGDGDFDVLLFDLPAKQIKTVENRFHAYLARWNCALQALGKAQWGRDGQDAASLLAAATAKRDHEPSASQKTPQPQETPKDAPPTDNRADPMVRVRHLAHRCAQTDIRIILEGETGVGKEVLAQWIHAQSPRKKGPFIAINCASLPSQLLESELFGNTQGAFTGAQKARKGLLEAADGGTLFLDEIGDMPTEVQVRLLRVLETRRVRPVGGTQSRVIDVRVLAATHCTLSEEVAQSRFRQDLYFRLNGVTLILPPLRQRPEQILSIADELLADIRTHAGGSIPSLAQSARKALQEYHWPGNIRQLRNVLERALVLCDPLKPIQAEHIDLPRLEPQNASQKPQASAKPQSRQTQAKPTQDKPTSLREAIEALEKRRVMAALERHAGNQTQAAKSLGISRSTLASRIRSLEIASPSSKRAPKPDPLDDTQCG